MKPVLRNLLVKALFTFTCILLARSAASADQRQTLPRALWAWDTTVIADNAKRGELFEFAKRKGITRLFQNTGSAFLGSEQAVKSKHPVTQEALATFLKDAHARGLQVDGLDGDPHQALTANHATVLAQLQRALDYDRDAEPAARLDGWQWDIEPYILPEFKAGGNARRVVMHQYLELVTASRDEVKAATSKFSFALGYAIPWWADTPEHALDWNGASKPVTFHQLDILSSLPDSYLAIMSYRNTAKGPNGTIAMVTPQIDYAAAHAAGVHLWIGQETGAAKNDPPSITFYGKNEAEFNRALAAIDAKFAASPVVAGIAIHHWKSYRELTEKPSTK